MKAELVEVGRIGSGSGVKVAFEPPDLRQSKFCLRLLRFLDVLRKEQSRAGEEDAHNRQNDHQLGESTGFV